MDSDNDGTTLGKRDLRVGKQLFHHDYNQLPQNVKDWITAAHEVVFNTVKDKTTLVWYDVASILSPELFDHKFGPSQSVLKSIRDREYTELMNDNNFTNQEYNFVLNKLVGIFRAMNSDNFEEAIEDEINP
jgi:hypothetical protein